jgi:hypothetical protein
MKMKPITLFILSLISFNLLGQKTYYVKTNAAGKGDGSSWENSAADLQSVINKAFAGDQVWVAGGTYYPTVRINPDIERSKSFVTKVGVNVYGGFYGTEQYIGQREKSDLNRNNIIEPWEFTNQTILSGDLLKNDNYDNWPDNSNNEDNAFHVVFMYSDFSPETVLDGFTIRGGNTKDAFYSENWGGGVYQWENSLLKNSVIEFNCSIGGYGGGVYSKGKVKYCVIRNNYSTYEGGGICSIEEITNSLIINNFSEGNGGGIINRGKVTNCIIANNSSTGDFNGGINNLTGKVTNCTIVRNTALKGTGGIYNNGAVYNSIIWQNFAHKDNLQVSNSIYGVISYCALNESMNNCVLLENENTGNQGPNFINESKNSGYQKNGTEFYESVINADWSLSLKSYCVDKGNKAQSSGTDILDNKRTGNPDIGAYEPIQNESLKYAQLSNTKGIPYSKSINISTDVINMGTPAMIQYGFCYSTNENPDTSAFKIKFFYSQIINGFSAEIKGLSSGTTYYFRPFAVHYDSTLVYGNELSISTLKSLVVSENGIVYVKTIGTGRKDGSSWENATEDLQMAIDIEEDHEVWIQSGKYVPKVPEITNDVRKTHFLLRDGVSIFGGFSGTETLKEEREKADMNLDGLVSQWEYKNQTILSGDLSGNDIYSSWPLTTNNSENCYQVVCQSDDFEIPTLLEGVIVQGGNNNSVALDKQAAGIYIRKNTKLQNSVVQFNQAGSRNAFGTGVYCISGEIDACLVRNNFTNNETSKGTGIYIIDGKLNNSKIESNKALNYYAFGVGVNAENSIIENSIIRNNYSKTKIGEGGGIRLYRGKVNNTEIINNEIENLPEFPNNQFGGGIYSQKGIVTNSVIEKNKISGSGGGIYTDTTIYNSVIQYNSALSEGGGIYGTGALIYNSKIGFNKSIASGGGIFNGANNYNTAVIENCEVFANSSDQDAGGIYLYNSKLVNSVIFNNFCKNDYSASSGISVSDGGLITNSTIVNNKINYGNGNTYALFSGHTLVMNCVIWGNNTTANQFKNYGTTKYCAVLDGDGIIEGVNANIVLERENSGIRGKYPYFKQPTSFAGLPETAADTSEILNADWSLLDKSALIDAGSQDTTGLYLPDSCINGERRFVSTLDIGAYEFIPKVITLPAVVYKPDSVTFSGEITSSFIKEVKGKGIIYSFEQHPVFGNSEFVNNDSKNKGIYTFVLEDLEPFKNYFFRAYAISSDLDTLYGEINSVYIASPLNTVNNIIYVLNEPKGNGSGSSWDNATADLAGAIKISQIGGQVWVGEGTYTPNNISKYNTDRNQSFVPKEGVNVFGGFAGIENSLEERIKTDNNGDGKTDSWEYQYKSILSGDIDSIKDNYINANINSLMAVMRGNSFRVVNQEKPFTNETIWEGVLIRGGYGNKDVSGNKAAGAFIQEKLLIRNCIIDFNLVFGQNGMGAGIYVKNSGMDSSLISNNYVVGDLSQGAGIYSELSEIAYCNISRNSGTEEASYGGGIYNTGMVRNSVFYDNKLKGDAGRGAGVYNHNGRLINCKIFNNLNEGIKGNYYVPAGGGIYNFYGDIIGCVVFNNQVTDGYVGGIYSDYGRIINTTISNNYNIESGLESTFGLTADRTQVVNSLVWNSPLLGEDQFFYSLMSSLKNSAFQNWKNDPGFEEIINLSTSNCDNNKNSPCFVNPTNFVGIAKDSLQREVLFNSNWEITEASVFLDAGLKDTSGLNLPKFTINGQPRLSSRIDIGAYEFNLVSQTAPVAIIKATSIVNEGDIVILDGSSSFDTENDMLTYNWSASGIILDSTSTKITTFSAPWISGNKEIVIQLIVSDGILNDTTITSVFIQDITSSEESKQSGISVYPNPFNNEIFIQLNKSGKCTIKVFSVTGELIFVRNQIDTGVTLNTTQYPVGVYLLHVTTDEGINKFKLIKY